MKTDAPPRAARRETQPMPEILGSVQPGGGVGMRLEQAWGRWRRWYLKQFRPGYVRRMAALRRGNPAGAPHEILDPRDLKYCRNQCTLAWAPQDDPFAWRDRLRLARWGLGELVMISVLLLPATAALLWWGPPVAYAAALTAAAWAIVVYFFRDPRRHIPQEAGALVSPADGKVVEISHLAADEFIGGPAVRIGIFLSLLNVHINRAPSAVRVVELRYSPGLFLNAMNPESAIKNENLWIGLEEESPPHRPLVVRQISGLVARRICCDLKPGDVVARGDKFGMIKLGSRTELIVPDAETLEVGVRVGQTVRAGSDVLVRYLDY